MKRLPIQSLAEKEKLATLIYLAFSLFLAIKAVPGVGTSNQAPPIGQAAAPWIFGPVQVLLFYFSPWISAILFPVIILSAFISLPWINKRYGDKVTRGVIMVISGTLLILLIWFMVKEQVKLQ